MLGRASLLAGLGAVALAHVMPYMPERADWVYLVSGLLVLSVARFFMLRVLRRGAGVREQQCKRSSLILLTALWAFALGLAWACLQIEHRLSDALAHSDEDKVSRVELRIDTLVRTQPGSRRFEAEVLSSKPPGIPRRILVSWNTAEYQGPYRQRTEDSDQFPELVPGQVWRMALNLRRPHGVSNPHGFDYEGHLFAQGVRAVGSVRGTPRYLRDEPWANLPVVAERARHRVREAMAPYVDQQRYGAVLRALAIGDQAGVSSQDWQVFNRTSITHLVSISGSHITLIAAVGGLLTLWGWKRAVWRGRPLAERLPAQVASCLVALLVAWLYCLLAGWGVPARRTFLMLAVLAAAHLSRLQLGSWRVLLLAAVAVVVMDPWALMASGFWLSFGAVAVLLASGVWLGSTLEQEASGRARIVRWLKAACLLQLAVTVGLMPILAWLFNEVSVVSPLANAYAIPVISLVVTPLSLLLAGAAMVPGLELPAQALAWLAHGALQTMMVPTRWLAQWELARLDAAAAPIGATLLALFGIGVAMLPSGLPWRSAGWFLILPALLWRPERPPEGGWNMVALDVGQGSAILIQTANHALLFDTGLRHGPDSDVAARTITPLLRAKGVKHLDVLVVSHADLDHAGGIRSLLGAQSVTQSYSSFDLVAYLRREGRLLGVPNEVIQKPQVLSRCEQGNAWTIDGVKFEFLWPLDTFEETAGGSESSRRNAQSCVLRIQGEHHSVLLTGDIGVAQERELVRMGVGQIDVVAAAHHGSRSSSGTEFVKHTGATHAVAQAGRWNRYGHPHPTVQRRWERAGAIFWRTDLHGAILLRSRSDGLKAEAWRQTRARHWNRI